MTSDLTEYPSAAVLTGDLIKSAALGRDGTDAAIACLSGAAEAFGAAHEFDPRFTRVRGDGWQMLCPDPARALRAALALTAFLRASTPARSRVAVGIGAAALPDAGGLEAGSGSAFERSGRALDDMPPRAIFALAAPDRPPEAAALFRLAGAMADRWTQAQAEALGPLLADASLTQRAVASRIGTSPQALADRLSRSDYDDLTAALDVVEAGMSPVPPPRIKAQD